MIFEEARKKYEEKYIKEWNKLLDSYGLNTDEIEVVNKETITVE